MSADWLKYVAKYHNEYLAIVTRWGAGDYSEDVVQEMYLRLNKYSTKEKIVVDNEVNKAYVWFVLRNIFNDLKKQGKKVQVSRLSDKFDLEDTADFNHEKKAFEAFISNIESEINSWEWYDRMLFTIYRDSNLSMRELSSKTQIGLSSIFNTLKNCKERLIKNCGEDYEDFLNEDYERI